MAITFLSLGGRASSASATTLTPTLTQASGDLLFALVANGSSGTTINTPSGWTQLNQSNPGTFNTGVFYIISTGSNANPVFTWTGASACTATIARFSGTSGTGVGTNGGATTGTTNPHTSASFNSTAANSVAVAFDFQKTGTTQATTPGGWTSDAVSASGTAAISNAVWQLSLGASGSASGAISVTETAVAWTQIQVELLAPVVAAPFTESVFSWARSPNQYIPDTLPNPAATALYSATTPIFRNPLITPTKLSYQYIPDVVCNSVVLVPHPRKNTHDFNFATPARQYIPSVIPNWLALTASGNIQAPFVNPDISKPYIARQYIPDVVRNPVALSVGQTAPFSPVNFDIQRSIKQYVPDALLNPNFTALYPATTPIFRDPLITPIRSLGQYSFYQVPNWLTLTAAGAVQAPFVNSDINNQYIIRQYVPDVVRSALVLAPAPASPLGPTVTVELPKASRSVADVGTNPILPGGLAVVQAPFVPPLYDMPAGTRQYVPVVLINPVALAAGPAFPFIPVNFDIQPSAKQYVPDVVRNVTINLQSVLVTFIPAPADTPRNIKQVFVPDILFNPVALATPPPLLAPFEVSLFDLVVIPGKQYIPHVLINPVALSAGPSTPFRAFAHPSFAAGKQYVPDVVINSVALASSPVLLNPFTVCFPDKLITRQYVPDGLVNPILPGGGIVLAAPFSPSSLLDQPKQQRQFPADVGLNITILYPAATSPLGPTLVRELPTGRQYVPEVLPTSLALSAPVTAPPFTQTSIDPPRPGRQYWSDVVLNQIPLNAAVGPFSPCQDGQQGVSKQYVPDVARNSTISLPQTQAVPFAPALLDQPRQSRPSRADVGINPVVPLQSAVPFAPALLDQPKQPRPSRADVGINSVVPLQSAVPFAAVNFDPPRAGRQYVPQILPTSLALSTPVTAPPFSLPSIEPPRPGRQYRSDAALNRLPLNAAFGLAAPFIPYQAVPPRVSSQYVPDVARNSTIGLPQPQAAPFVSSVFETPRSLRQYIPDVVRNGTIALPQAQPFVPAIFGAPRTSRQYIPDVALNPVSGIAPPFVPLSFDAPKAPKQYVPDVQQNIILGIAPFVNVIFNIASVTKQYQADTFFNTLILELVPPPPFVPYIYEPQRIIVQFIPEVLFNPVALEPGPVPAVPGTSIFEVMGGELNSVLRAGIGSVLR